MNIMNSLSKQSDGLKEPIKFNISNFQKDFLVIIIYSMINKRPAKNLVDGYYVSISINVIAFIIILILWLRKRSSSQKTPQTINTIIQTKRQEEAEANKRIQTIQNSQQQLKNVPIDLFGRKDKLLNRKIFQFHQATQTDHPELTNQHVRLLKEQLQIQRDRNYLLEQKHLKLEAQLVNIKNSGEKPIPKEVQDLKNQLEFCQQRLKQAIKSQTQLKQRLEGYQRMSISMLNHPEYQRLRQLNNKYKDTIATLQNHLLNKHQHKENYIDLSFHNL